MNNQNRKRLILMMIVGTCLALLSSGCASEKSPLSLTEFTDAMEKKELEVVDAADQVDPSLIKGCKIAMKSDEFQIELYQAKDVSAAKNAYDANVEKFKEQSQSKQKPTEVSLSNYSKYTQSDEVAYYVISRVDDTFIYISAAVKYKSEIEKILKEINY